MTKKEAMKKYGIKPQVPVNLNERCITKMTDYRNLDHPYCNDNSKYDKLQFFLMLTNFEKGGLFGYDSKKMPYEDAVVAFNEIGKDWERPGRRAWNSVALIGIDEQGGYFLAMS